MIALTIFILILFFGFFSILFGFPGTVVIFFASVVYSLANGFDRIGFKALLILAAISLAAEFLEFYMGVKGATKFGLSKKGVIASLLGAIAGAALLTPFFLGLGTLIGTFLGGLAGILTVELIRRNRLKPAMRASWGCLLGRIGGILTKGCCAMAMIIIDLSAVYS
jgi:uncharacterized protein YqgC (DUF456 family)